MQSTQETIEPAGRSKATDYITFVIVVSAFAVLTLHTNNCFWFYTGKEDFWFSANIICDKALICRRKIFFKF